METVAVKEAIDRFAAKLLTPKRSQKLIKEAAQRALARLDEMKPHRIAGPIEFEITTKLTSMAHMCTLFPTVERRGPKVVAVRSDCYLEAYRQLLGCLIISGATARGWL
ncbi:MAG: M55 family metallopeptidase [Firmicutes bacterium]|nr:M55 family metallopeptidase [Bacillota bacterium]